MMVEIILLERVEMNVACSLSSGFPPQNLSSQDAPAGIAKPLVCDNFLMTKIDDESLMMLIRSVHSG